MQCTHHVTYLFPAPAQTTNMLTDKNNDVQFISKAAMSNLFKRSLAYHRTQMRKLFRTHYCPFRRDDQWICPLPEGVVNEFRLHLSWDLGVGVFHWSRSQVATKILQRYEQLGILKFLRAIAIQERHV